MDYLRRKVNQKFYWELSNIEHLAEKDSEPVAITRYENIPDDALDVRTFRVDLRKCQGKRQD